jgi:putative phosphoesterase
MSEERAARGDVVWLQCHVLVGLVSDTHGLVRPELFTALGGVELILHAGDVGGREVLQQIRAIAPVHAVYGNTDPPGEPGLTQSLALELGGRTIHVSHGHEVGSPTPEILLSRYTADVIVFGHTHKPLIERSGDRLVVNPGAAGPRRFDVRPSVARMTVSPAGIEVSIRWL